MVTNAITGGRRARNFFHGVLHEARPSRQTWTTASTRVASQSDCALVARPSDFIGSSPSARSIDRPIDRSLAQASERASERAIVKPQLASRSDFSLPRRFRSRRRPSPPFSINLVFVRFPCSFLASLFFPPLCLPLLPSRSLHLLLHCRFSIEIWVQQKPATPLAISEYQSACKSVGRTREIDK